MESYFDGVKECFITSVPTFDSEDLKKSTRDMEL